MFLQGTYVPRASTFTQNPEFSLPKGFSCGGVYINVCKYMYTYIHAHKKNPKNKTTPQLKQNLF